MAGKAVRRAIGVPEVLLSQLQHSDSNDCLGTSSACKAHLHCLALMLRSLVSRLVAFRSIPRHIWLFHLLVLLLHQPGRGNGAQNGCEDGGVFESRLLRRATTPPR